ncbi:MAG: fasciclin domain-containing protein [Caldilineaceae bacterium]
MKKITTLLITVVLSISMFLGACQLQTGQETPSSTIPATATPTGDATSEVTSTVTVTGTSAGAAAPAVTTTASVTESAGITNTLDSTSTATIDITSTPRVEATPVLTTTPTVSNTASSIATSTPVSTANGATEVTFIDFPPLDTDMTDRTIAEIISTSVGFGNLTTALESANLMGLLNGPGPITLFAPTDNAFVNYPEQTIEDLLANPAILSDLLQYHLVVDNSPAAQLAELGGIVTYLGEPANITISADGEFFVNDVVIVQTDIQAANGVIHVINGLLAPPSAQSLLSSRTVNPQAETDAGARDITLEQLAALDTSALTVQQIISSVAGFSTLTAAVDSAGLNDALSSGGPVTLLAPTNGAFAELPENELERLLNAAPDELVQLLQYHIILDGATSGDLAQLGSGLTAAGEPVTVAVNNDGVITLNGGAATVFMADIEASNGIIHAISAVLTPPTP